MEASGQSHVLVALPHIPAGDEPESTLKTAMETEPRPSGPYPKQCTDWAVLFYSV
jgi:hypothetical protein